MYSAKHGYPSLADTAAQMTLDLSTTEFLRLAQTCNINQDITFRWVGSWHKMRTTLSFDIYSVVIVTSGWTHYSAGSWLLTAWDHVLPVDPIKKAKPRAIFGINSTFKSSNTLDKNLLNCPVLVMCWNEAELCWCARSVVLTLKYGDVKSRRQYKRSLAFRMRRCPSQRAFHTLFDSMTILCCVMIIRKAVGMFRGGNSLTKNCQTSRGVFVEPACSDPSLLWNAKSQAPKNFGACILNLVRHESQLLVEFRLRWRLQIIYQFNLVLWKDIECRSRPPFTIWRNAWFSEHSSAKCQYQRKLRMRKAMFHSCQPVQLSISHQPGLKWCSASRIGIICTYVWTYVYISAWNRK